MARRAGETFDGMRVMKSNVSDQTETDLLTLDVSDDALERAAAVADAQRITVGYCTHWYTCDWPLSPAERTDLPGGERAPRA
jgi:hypothetical protein